MSARFSRRLGWSAEVNALAQAEAEATQAGVSLIDLTVSNPTRVGLAYPGDAIVAALADRRSLRYEPSPRGMREARCAVAEYYRARGALVDPEHVVLTASTSEAYSFLFKLLCDAGDAVLAPRPSYPLFDFLAALDGVALAPYLLGFDGEWHVDFAALQQAIADTPRARAILLCSPNNPTGSFLKREERDRLVGLARDRGIALIADEVFADYGFGDDARRLPTLADEAEVLSFSLSGLSKVAGLPQVKLAWIAVAGPAAAREQALARLDLIADTYLSVATPVQVAAPALLALRHEIGGQISARTRANLAALQQATAGTAAEVLRVEGGWYAVVRIPAVRSDEEWALSLLRGDGVLVQPGYFYDFPREAYLVVSLLAPEDAFGEGARRLVARVGAAR